MSPPDWERADRFWSRADQPGAERSLAHRLSRLPSSHPSARPGPDRAEAEYRERDREEWWRPVADAESADADIGPEDRVGEAEDGADGPDSVPPGDEADLEDIAGVPGDAGPPATSVRGGRRSEASAGWGELGGPSSRSPYRPWFSGAEAADPWFAVGETE